MMKKLLFLLSAAFLMSNATKAQYCGTDEMNRRLKEQYPQIETYEKTLNQQIENYLKNAALGNSAQKGTGFTDADTLHIPVVVHVVHDYTPTTYIQDNKIYALIDYINEIYMAKTTSELANVIPTYQSYIGTAKIQFHLATKDPLGNDTKGITHRWSYLTYGGDNQAKFDVWAPESYVNIWLIDFIGSSTPPNRTLAYATPPATAAAAPHYDGVIGEFNSSLNIGPGNDYTIPHELGHVLNLQHTWGSTNSPGVACGDDDVDDTPPTDGSFGCALYDTGCNNSYVPTSKIIIDSAARVADSIDGASIDFQVKTGITLRSVDIYPLRLGEAFDIVLQDKNGNPLKSFAASENVGDTAVDSGVRVDNNIGKIRGGINFDLTKNVRIEKVSIFPNALNQPFTIILTNGTDTVAKYTDTTRTLGEQVVPVDFFAYKRANYWMYMSVNPGLKHDTGVAYPTVGTAAGLTFKYYKDTTTGTTQGYYNYLYNWSVRYKGVTDTALTQLVDNKKKPYTVPLDWVIYPGDYKLVLTENNGLSHDIDTTQNYNKTIQCVVSISNERATDNTYDYMYNWNIRYGYIKGNKNGDCFDYPDTTNVQNIMNYSTCKLMFTKGQVARMRAALASTIGNRNKLVTIENAKKTGIYNENTGKYGQMKDLPPVADFSVEKVNGSRNYYMCANNVSEFNFMDRSWGDTITKVSWEFTGGATPATPSGGAGNAPKVKFEQAGWVNVKLTATGNNSGDATISREAVVYAADPDFKLNPMAGYFQEFNPNTDVDKWPVFNYFNNASKWQVIDGNGFFDKTCIMYTGFDDRGSNAGVGSPGGDYDDFFSPAFDLSAIGADASLNFMYSGAYRTAIPGFMRDTLEIAYSVDCGNTWKELKKYTNEELSTKGTYTLPYAPLYYGDWAQKSVDIPANLRVDRLFLRFRFKAGPGQDFFSTGTGNNFYLDRINITPYPAGINTIIPDNKEVVVAPNPTANNSYVIIRNSIGGNAQIRVTDITGKLIYSTQQTLKDKLNRIEIPASVIAVKGIYMVQVSAGERTYNEKLIVY